MKIGFQGDLYSNSHNAAIAYSKQSNIDLVEVPLINSYPVLDALIKQEIDYGVVAFENSTAGLVNETNIAINAFKNNIEEVGEIILPIHHCLFGLASENKYHIKNIYSHEQALRQCDIFIRDSYPDAVIVPEKDTSLAALNLVSNKYTAESAVICNKECGFHYGLELIQENIENNKNNQTTFKIFVRKG